MTRRAGAIKHLPGARRLQTQRGSSPGRTGTAGEGGKSQEEPQSRQRTAAVMGSHPAVLLALALCALLEAGESRAGAGLGARGCPHGRGDPLHPLGVGRGLGVPGLCAGAAGAVRDPRSEEPPGLCGSRRTSPRPSEGTHGRAAHPSFPPCAATGLGHPPAESHLAALPRSKRCSCNSWLDKECIYFCHLDIIWVNTPG